MIRQSFPGAIRAGLSDRQFRFTASTSALGRDRNIVEPSGIETQAFRRNPVLLWQHDPTQPVGKCVGLHVADNELRATGEFAPAGVSPRSDEICALLKAGVLNSVSIGFEPTESKPINPQHPRDGMHILRCELLEISIVAIPADCGALVTERALRSMSKPTIGALRSALAEIGEHHKDILDGLTRGRLTEGRRALSRAERSLDRAVNLGMTLDQLNTSKAQTSAGLSFGTSDGHGPASLEAADKPRSISFVQRQADRARLAAAAPRIEVCASAAVAREVERNREYAELAARAGCFKRDLSRRERQVQADRLRRI
jgi:HK97 family phage prohead protease